MTEITIYKLIEELKALAYNREFRIVDDKIFFEEKDLYFNIKDLFFVDAAFRNLESMDYIFAISFPRHDLKGTLIVNEEEFSDVILPQYGIKFNLPIRDLQRVLPIINIRRQYGMRKISRDEFDINRYELRFGFPDFPLCPYGHQFKSLGFDKETLEYVRFTSSILKKEIVKTRTWKD